MKGETHMSDLTSKETLFCTYCSLGNAPREAAAKSGYLFPERAAVKLLRKKEIASEIDRLTQQRENTDLKIAMGYYRLAFGCISDAVNLMFCDELSTEQIEKMDLFNISEIKRKKGGDIEIKFFDRLKALEKLESLSTADGEESSLYAAIEKGAKALREERDE